MNPLPVIDLVYERQWSSLNNLVKGLQANGRLGTLYGGFPCYRYLKSGIPAQHLKTFPVAALWNHLVLKTKLPGFTKLEEPRWVGNWVARQHHSLAPLVMANGTAHRYLFPRLRGSGRKLILERGSMHPEDYFHFPQQARKEAGFSYQMTLPNSIIDEIEKNRFADFLIAGSEMVRESYCKRGFPTERAFTCRYGVDPERYPLLVRTPPIGRNLRVAAIGVVGFRKGLYRLIQLGEWALARKIPLEIHLAGPIEDSEAHQMLAKTSASIHCHGVVKGPKFREFLQMADVCAVFSYEEGLPVAMLEAMASGLPAWVSTDTGAREVIDDGKDGILLESFSWESFDAKLAPLMNVPACFPTMGTAAHDKIIDHYTSERYIRDLTNILQQIDQLPTRND